MKILWPGTDSLMLIDYSMRSRKKRVYWWIFRRVIRLLEFFADSHLCNAQNVADNLNQFGVRKPIEFIETPLKYTEKFDKIPHNTFNVLYYFPKGGDQKFLKWLYGYDIYEQLREELPKVNFIVVDGSSDMRDVYPIIDLYIRPNRHDGNSRMVRECEIQNIPYCWSNSNPDINDFRDSILTNTKR